MKKNKVVAIILAASLALSGTGQVPSAQAETVKAGIKLSATTKSVTVGKKVKIKATIINKNKKKIGNIQWKVSKNGYIKMSSTNNGKQLTMKGLKKGNVTVSAKVKIGKKSFSKKCKIKVVAKKQTVKKATPTPKITKKPTSKATAKPKATKKPASKVTATPKATKKPTQAPTATPKATKKPTEAPSATPKATKEPTEAPTTTPEATKEPTEEPTVTPEVTQEPTQTPTATQEVTSVPTETPNITDELSPMVSVEPTVPAVVTGTTVTSEGAVNATTGSAVDTTTGSAIDTTTGAAVTNSPEEVNKVLKEWKNITDSKYVATQGFCSDGTNFYAAKQSNSQEVVIYRYSNKQSEPELFASRVHALGHANDMCYGNGLIYVATGGGSTDTDQATYGVIAFDMDGDVAGKYNFYTKDLEEIKPSGLEYDAKRNVF
ncbi:MAG: hypothetical protein II244_02680, partial [Clostridia bacterium]|nr:hypothetical protein [Clostridia bacterium]